MTPKDKLVKVYTAQGEMDANVVRGLLEACGIKSILTGNAARSMQPFVMDGMGRIDIMVDASQADEARDIIASSAADGETPSGENPPETGRKSE
jgi:hypothetical protein